MKSKHTPGPWKSSLAVVCNAPSVHVVTNGKWGAPNIAVVDNEANAQLVAAAPDMLAALEDARSLLVSTWGRNDTPEWVAPTLNAIDAAIVKAEGRE